MTTFHNCPDAPDATVRIFDPVGVSVSLRHNCRTAKLVQLSAVSSEPCVSSSMHTAFRLTIGRTKPAGIEILMDFTLIK